MAAGDRGDNVIDHPAKLRRDNQERGINLLCKTISKSGEMTSLLDSGSLSDSLEKEEPVRPKENQELRVQLAYYDHELRRANKKLRTMKGQIELLKKELDSK